MHNQRIRSAPSKTTTSHILQRFRLNLADVKGFLFNVMRRIASTSLFGIDDLHVRSRLLLDTQGILAVFGSLWIDKGTFVRSCLVVLVVQSTHWLLVGTLRKILNGWDRLELGQFLPINLVVSITNTLLKSSSWRGMKVFFGFDLWRFQTL